MGVEAWQENSLAPKNPILDPPRDHFSVPALARLAALPTDSLPTSTMLRGKWQEERSEIGQNDNCTTTSFGVICVSRDFWHKLPILVKADFPFYRDEKFLSTWLGLVCIAVP